MHKSPFVSIIIPTKNTPPSYPACLESIINQTYHNVEVVVIDNHSTDDTRKISLKYHARFFTKGPERGTQKNYGAHVSRGEYIYFLDSDMVLTLDVVSECVKKSSTFDALIIPEVSEGTGFWNDCVILERSCYFEGDIHTEGIRFLTKKLFNSLGGFDESLVASGDDMDLSQRARRLGYKIGRTKAHIIHHEGPRSPWSTFKKWRYYGRNMGKYIIKNKNEVFFQYLPIRPAWLRNWRKLVADPIHTAGFIFLKACQFFGVVLGQIDSLITPASKLKFNPYEKSNK